MMANVKEPITADQLRIVPANQASWEDLDAIFGRTDPGRCYCQRYKIVGWIWRDSTQEQRTAALREQTACGNPDSPTTSGLVAYVDGQPGAWVAVEPRSEYLNFMRNPRRTPWLGRNENSDDESVWAVTCFVVRREYRGRGLTYHLAQAAAEHARERGARAVEAYAMTTEPGKVITWGDLHVGARQVFEEAGFTEVSHPSLRRVVMRLDFPARRSRRRA